MSPWHTHLDFGLVSLGTWTLLGRIPLALAVLALVLHARRFVRLPIAMLAASGLAAGVAVGTVVVPNIVGALAGGLVGWALALRALGVRLPWAFAVTRTLLVLVGVGRLGCLLAGCCFGTPTDLPWAVAYPVGALAHDLHLALGWASSLGPSRAVHPVPAYEAVFLLAAAAALPALRARVRNDRALALGAGAGYLMLRAALDPLRGMVNTPASVHPVGPLSVAQWGFVAAALGLAVAAWRLPRTQPGAAPSDAPSVRRALAVWLGAAGAFAACQASLPPFVAALVIAVFGLAGLLLAREALLATNGAQRLEAALVALGLLLLVPAGLRASSGEDAGRYWVYAVDAPDGRLVHIGDQSTPPSVLAQHEADLNPADAPSPAAPDDPWPVVRMDEEPPLTRRQWPATPWRLPAGNTLTFYGGGGYLVRKEEPVCSGPATLYRHVPLYGGVGFGRAGEVRDRLQRSWQVRLGVVGDRWRTEADCDPGLSRSGLDLMGVVGGMVELDSGDFAAGFGGTLGLGRSRAPDRLSPSLGSLGFVVPGLYLRFGTLALAYETGTISRDQFWPYAFGGFRWSIGRHDFGTGIEISRWWHPLSFFQVYGSARLRFTDAHALLLRVDVPVAGPYVTGSLGWSIGF